MFGIINIFKEKGATSRDCVNVIQRLVRPHKVGHAGTLDPLAQGVLLVAVGQAVRLTELLHELPKVYVGEFWLGRRSPSVDTETPVELLEGCELPTEQGLKSVLPSFIGEIEQRPPIYSAIKVEGRRAYELAREGTDLDLPARKVTVHSIELISLERDCVRLRIECGTGTYIRSLGRDIARALGTDAIMTGLLRESIGSVRSSDGSMIDAFRTPSDVANRLLSPAKVIRRDLVRLLPQELQRVRQGLYVNLSQSRFEAWNGNVSQSPTSAAAIDEEGHLKAILTPRSGDLWGASMNFGSD